MSEFEGKRKELNDRWRVENKCMMGAKNVLSAINY
jgi:hypothetical protein